MYTLEQLRNDDSLVIEPGEFVEYARAYMDPCEVDHWDPSGHGIMGDLYVMKNETSDLLVSHLSCWSLLGTFRDNIDGRTWYELPFCWRKEMEVTR